MKVLALDLSITATGVATPRGDLSTFRPTSKGDHRLDEITGYVAELSNGPNGIDLAVIEGAVTRSQAATVIGMVHGAVRAMFILTRVPYLVVPPAALKTYATGKGNAPKPDMRMELYKRTGADIADDNQVDAAWLRYLALDLAGHAVFPLPQTHRRALDKLTLPETIAA